MLSMAADGFDDFRGLRVAHTERNVGADYTPEGGPEDPYSFRA